MANPKTLVNSFLARFDIAVTRLSTLEKLQMDALAKDDLEILKTLPDSHASRLIKLMGQSKSQLRQDLFVLSQTEFKKNGFFVEFGATNGVDLSNTHLLEKEFEWTGILAEPAKRWHQDLSSNREAAIEHRCVWKDSNSTLIFNETNEAEYSTILEFSETDFHKNIRKRGKTYSVRTISLNDLLSKHHAPNEIDYLSIDTEGSEYEILRSLDFGEYAFRVITCEHNFTPARDQVFALLSEHGYVRVFEHLSKFDDWYVRST
jgi:FkbM family methyltransferase